MLCNGHKLVLLEFFVVVVFCFLRANAFKEIKFVCPTAELKKLLSE